MLETTIAGSLPKPAWLAKPRMLWAPWQLEGEALVEAKRDATLLVLKEQEDAGIDIVTDGEQARQHFVHGFLENIKGIDFTRRVTMGIRNNRYNAEVPTVPDRCRAGLDGRRLSRLRADDAEPRPTRRPAHPVAAVGGDNDSRSPVDIRERPDRVVELRVADYRLGVLAPSDGFKVTQKAAMDQ
jgi:hypothetical protein